MKVLPVLMACGVAATAAAQKTAGMYEADILTAYTALQSDSTYELTLTGSQTLGKAPNTYTRTFTSYLYWNYSPNSTNLPQIELQDWDTTTSPSRLVRRYVGDGRTLWFYDMQNLKNLRFMASAYSYYGATAPANSPVPPDGYAAGLLSQLYAEAKGPSTFMVRLLREVNPGASTVAYPPIYASESWAPGYGATSPPTVPGVNDPLFPTWNYSDGGNTEWVNYGVASPTNPTRTVSFNLYDVSGNNSGQWTLVQINSAESDPNRFAEWTLAVTDPVTPPAGTFVPYPASTTAGWQQMSSQKLG